MMKRYPFLFALLLAGLLFAGCSSKPPQYAIYFPAEKTTPAALTLLAPDQLKLSDKMLLAPEDIVAYEQNTHKLILTAAGYQKLLLQEVPLEGLPFIAAVGDKPVYPIALWTPLSSATFDGLIIMEPHEPNVNEVYILTGYPTDKFFSGVDPRTSPVVLQAFRDAGKLR